MKNANMADEGGGKIVKKQQVLFTIAAAICFVPNICQANVGWMYAATVLVGAGLVWMVAVVVVSLLIETPFLQKLVKVSYKDAINITFVMNMYSAFAGLFIVPLFLSLTDDNSLAIFIPMTVISTLIEMMVVEKVYSYYVWNNRGFLYIGGANIASNVFLVSVILLLRSI